MSEAASSQAPKRGDIVAYTLPEWQHAPNGEPTVPAIVTVVHSDTCVNLRLFHDHEPIENAEILPEARSVRSIIPEWRTSVVRRRGENGATPAPGCWDYIED